MFCNNCGTENTNGAKFCKACGQPLAADSQQKKMTPPQFSTGSSTAGQPAADTGTTANQQSSSLNMPQMPKVDTDKLKESIQKLPKQLIAGVAVAIVIIIAAVIIICKAGRTIDLDKYVVTGASGYDGYGHAYAYVDWDVITEKYGDKVKLSSKAKKMLNDEFGSSYITSELENADFKPVMLLEYFVNIDTMYSSNLSNGDTSAYYWNIDSDTMDELCECLNIKVKYTEDDTVKFDIDGLKELTKFDAFANLTIEYSGIAPDGRVELSYDGTEFEYYDFKCDKTEGLSNGDVITVTIDESAVNDCAIGYGKVPTESGKEYTVEGLSSYLTSDTEVTEAFLEKMKAQAVDVYNAKEVATMDTATENLQAFDYLGYYLLTAKNESSSPRSSIYLVYKANIRDVYNNGAQNFDQAHDVYWYIRFENAKIAPDGTADIDVTDYSTTYNEVHVSSGISNGWFGTMGWNNRGYESIDALYNDAVLKNVDKYNHYDHVGAAAPAAETAPAETEAPAEAPAETEAAQ